MNVWIQIGILIVSLIVSYATRPKPIKPRPPALDDFDFPQFEEGTPQIVVFGDVWLKDWMVLTVGNYRTTPIKAGGKK